MAQLPPLGKQFNNTRSADQSALCYIKTNTGLPLATTDAGAALTASTVEVQANQLLFTVNGAAETTIGTYTGNSGADNAIVFADANIANIQRLINTINGRGVGHPAPSAATYLRRWRAGLGDFRPQFVIGAGDGLVTAAANSMLGRGDDGLAALADSSGLAAANTISIGCGVGRALEGGGQQIPDHFESDYESDTAGNKTPTRFPERRVEDQPAQASFQVVITDIKVGALFATTKLVTVYDNAGNTLKTESLGAATSIAGSGDWSRENPYVTGPVGSPLWVEISGTGAFTDGACTVSGFRNIA